MGWLTFTGLVLDLAGVTIITLATIYAMQKIEPDRNYFDVGPILIPVGDRSKARRRVLWAHRIGALLIIGGFALQAWAAYPW